MSFTTNDLVARLHRVGRAAPFELRRDAGDEPEILDTLIVDPLYIRVVLSVSLLQAIIDAQK